MYVELIILKSVTTFNVVVFPLLTHNQSGKTALQVAEDEGHTQVVELLKKAVLNEQEQMKTGIILREEHDCEFLNLLLCRYSPALYISKT